MVMVDAMFGRGAEVQGDAVLRTVDQALLAGLPCKFATPRPWGLAQKILIVDEAHEMGRQPKAAARCPAAGVLLCGAGPDRAAGGAGVACLWVRSAVMIACPLGARRPQTDQGRGSVGFWPTKRRARRGAAPALLMLPPTCMR